MLTVIITLWTPISSFFSGLFVGFICIGAIAFCIIRLYLNARADETVVHEWIDFPQLEGMGIAKTPTEDKHTTLHVCVCVCVRGTDTCRIDPLVLLDMW
jgi:hypothetical protein